MKENTQEKNLIEKEEKITLFGKIKNFFKNLFGKKQVVVDEIEEIEENVEKEPINDFKEAIKLTKLDEEQLLELQKRYRDGEIGEKELTNEQIDALCDLYDKQIEEIKQSIKLKEEIIEECKRRLEDNKKAS